jgi:hypothetical protein
MSALPDSDDFDVYDPMEIESRLSFVVGYVFQQAAPLAQLEQVMLKRRI